MKDIEFPYELTVRSSYDRSVEHLSCRTIDELWRRFSHYNRNGWEIIYAGDKMGRVEEL